MLRFFNTLFDLNKRELKRLLAKVKLINQLEPEVKAYKTADFAKAVERLRHKAVEDNLTEADRVLAFALVRQAAVKTLGMRHFDVQLMAAWALSEGKVVEQKTGEGKTLSATPALFVNALYGKGAHLVTVNDYLAKRDAGWMGPIFHLLGLTVGVVVHDQAYLYDPTYTDAKAQEERLAHLKPVDRRQAYQADITYGTNNEFGFDYLRDNMVSQWSEKVQRGHFYAIVDEVDSILIDEARTPLIISAPAEEDVKRYLEFARLAGQLQAGRDYEVDAKRKSVALTDHGVRKVEKGLGLSNLYEESPEIIHHLEQALRAKDLFHKDKDYIIKEGQVIIVDEHTGRLMYGRRYSEGLHQAIEAKEGVPIQKRSKTMATISLQNYFRMYKRLSGMTGTAATEAEEFEKIYHLQTIVIPTHKPVIRQDFPDKVYRTTRAKFAAIIHEVQRLHDKDQPVLIGTRSIEVNQIISNFLKRKGIPHNVLNAKQHEKEAQIIAQAGRPGAVTVATNMAGRGVDIVLGGAPPEKPAGLSDDKYKKTADYKDWQARHDQVIKAGGLAVLGSERHESRRIDNQLRGRAGRQGDPGMSRFFVALDDEIMSIFGGEQIANLMTAFNLPENQPLEHKLVSKVIEQVQTKVESFYFDIRKSLVEYDDVINKQRQIIYRRRDRVLKQADQDPQRLLEQVKELVRDQISSLVEFNTQPSGGLSSQQAQSLIKEFAKIIPLDPQSQDYVIEKVKGSGAGVVKQELESLALQVIEMRQKQYGDEVVFDIARVALLKAIDDLWVDHIDVLTELREGVSLRGFAQKDPLVEYKQEAFRMFQRLTSSIDRQSLYNFYHLVPQQVPQAGLLSQNLDLHGPADNQLDDMLKDPQGMNSPAHTPPVQQTIRHKRKIGRNDPCWCGSGKKWKKCHYPDIG